MNEVSGDPQEKRHTLSDWLVLHGLDRAACCRILDGMACEGPNGASTGQISDSKYQAIDLDAAWSQTIDAMRHFLPQHHGIIDNTYEKTIKIVVDQHDKQTRALTLDNGPQSYPTIVLCYRGKPSDSLVIAHEFAHALQIKASQGKFVPPILREVCAFLGEGALVSHALYSDDAQYDSLKQAWRKANLKYFGAQKDRLCAALAAPDPNYDYSWNYPIARYLAIKLANQCSPEWIWSIFEGGISVDGILQELRLPEPIRRR